MDQNAMTKPIVDKAEVALEYPDKFYSGTFERSSRFEARFDTCIMAYSPTFLSSLPRRRLQFRETMSPMNIWCAPSAR